MSDSVGSMVGDVLDDEDEAGDPDEEEEMGPAGDFGIKIGVLAGLVAFYFFFVSPEKMIWLSPKSSDVFELGSGNTPFVFTGVATLIVALFGGGIYPLIADELRDDYKQDLAIGTIFAPAGVMLLLFALAVLEPTLNKFLAGAFLDGLGYFVVSAIVVAILLGSSIGIIIAFIFFGLYLGLPAYIGTFVGSFVGEIARNGPT
jgi:hypothetical protein